MHPINLLIVCILLIIVVLFLYIDLQNHKLLKTIDFENHELLKTVTKSHRGTSSERELVLTLLKKNIPAKAIFHDLYLINRNGYISQIDLVVATKVGMIVFEVKDYSGWIFGSGNQYEWTQILAYGKEKYRFYNPILQNQKHIDTLINQDYQFKNIPFYSVIVFYGDCQFKNLTSIPDNVFLIKFHEVSGVIDKILNENQFAPYTNKREIVNLLETAVLNGENEMIRQKHSSNIEGIIQRKRRN